MNTQVILVLDTRVKRADGTYPVILRIVHHRTTSQIKLGVHIQEKDWDKDKRTIKPSYRGTESVMRLNNLLQKKKTEATDIITKLDEQKTLDSYSVYQLRDLIEKKDKKSSFFSYTQHLIDELTKARRIGSARTYNIVLGVLRTYRKGKDLTFLELNYDFLLKFETAHFQKGNSQNGLAAYMRIVRAIYNKAIKDGLVSRELYPFGKYQIKTTKTKKRAISMQAINRIIALEFDPEDSLFHARNYFLLSFYMRGMSFADMAQLKLSNIIDGRIMYDRLKTDKPYNIKIIPEIEAILSFYTKGKTKEDYIFPIIHRIELIEQYKDVEWARKRFNKNLKKIAELCEIQENLTSYVSRHSFGTRAKNLGIPIATIAEMLGHSSSKTTEVYLDTLPSDIMDDAHEKIIR